MEMDDQAVELTAEQQAQEEADFEAAFNQVAGNTPTTEEATDPKEADADADASESQKDDEARAAADAEATAQAEAEAEAQAAAAQAATDEANAPVTITKAQLDAIQAQLARVPELEGELRRVHDTTAGRIGSLKQSFEQSVDALKAQAGKGNKVAIKQMKRLSEEYPELAQMLMEDLNDASGDGGTAAQPDAQATAEPAQAEPAAQPAIEVDPLDNPAVQAVLKQKEMAIVDAVHPDWRGLPAQPEFNEWKSQLPAAAQEMLASTWKSEVMIDAFNDFKAWRHTRTQQTQAQAETNKQRDKRLAGAIPATTGAPTGANAVDDDAAFEAGFKSVRR